MKLWSRWFGLGRQPPDERRWVVLDVETSGLDPARDDLLCVAALAMVRDEGAWSLVVQDSFERVLRPQQVRTREDNVLLHGIGSGAQQRGEPPAQVLEDLRTWVGSSVVLAFHADFDRAFLERACRCAGLPAFRWHWLDLADLLPLALAGHQAQSLDQWMAALGVVCPRRHEAAADVWATAQLWLKASAALQGSTHWRDWQARARQARWLQRRPSL